MYANCLDLNGIHYMHGFQKYGIILLTILRKIQLECYMVYLFENLRKNFSVIILIFSRQIGQVLNRIHSPFSRLGELAGTNFQTFQWSQVRFGSKLG